MSTEVDTFFFLLNPVHFILSTSGGSHCVIIDIKLYEVYLWSVDAVQCSQKCWMFLADKLTFFMKREHSFPPCVHANTCWPGIHVASSHALYFITSNITGTWIFHFMHTEWILCSVLWKWQYLGPLKHLHVLFMFIICPFVAYLFGHLLLQLWTYLLHCSYSFSQCRCSVSSWHTIVPGPIWIFFNSTMKELTITDEDAVFSLQFSCDFSVPYTLVWLGRTQFGTFYMGWRQSSVFKCQI